MTGRQPGSYVSERLSIRRLQPSLGAEISGVDLRRCLTRPLRDKIYSALLQYKVVFFRDQDITREQHIAFGRTFGELEINDDINPHPDHPEILQAKVDGKSTHAPDIWHVDQAWRAVPPCISILRAYTIPSLGGDTLFSNAAAAYDGLDDTTKARIENLRAENERAAYIRKVKGIDPTIFEKVREPPVSHPVVQIHPDTGERILFVNRGYTTAIVGLDRDESELLLTHLTEQFTRPEYQVRFVWRVNSIAMWDNRSVQHRAVSDYTEPRHMERVAVIGTAPIGLSDVRRPHPLPAID